MDAGFAVLVKQWTNALLFFKALVQVNRRRP
jgi:hypothetical protein